MGDAAMYLITAISMSRGSVATIGVDNSRGQHEYKTLWTRTRYISEYARAHSHIRTTGKT